MTRHFSDDLNTGGRRRAIRRGFVRGCACRHWDRRANHANFATRSTRTAGSAAESRHFAAHHAPADPPRSTNPPAGPALFGRSEKSPVTAGPPGRQALTVAMVHFAAETGCHPVAEGIESRREAAMVQQLGVEYGQGHLLGRPQPLAPPDAADLPQSGAEPERRDSASCGAGDAGSSSLRQRRRPASGQRPAAGQPLQLDFQFGDWLRSGFAAGNVAPWDSRNPDLTIVLAMAL